MLINKKYDYTPLEKFTGPNGRRYIVGESRPLPSVTTILSATEDKSHLVEWTNRVGEDEAKKITATAAGLGGSMHQNLENYIYNNSKPTGLLMVQLLSKAIINKPCERTKNE